MANAVPVIEVSGGNATPVTEVTSGNAMPVYGVYSGAQATPIVFVASGGAPIYIVGGLYAFDVSGVGLLTSLTEVSAALASDPSADVTMLRDYDATRDGVFLASPLGTTSATTYTGTFDGGGFSIRNFNLLDTSATPGLEDGLFGNVGNNSGIGTVKNLTVNGTLTQTAWERTTFDPVSGRYLLGTTVGGVVGSLRGVLDNVTSNMTVFAAGSGGQAGGMVGRVEKWPNKTIIGITKANPGVVTITAHGMATGTRIFIKNVAGMTEVNDAAYIITSLTADTFSIGVDTTAYTAYTSGGIGVGGGTVKNCTSNASVTLSDCGYRMYQSPLVASNRSWIDNCVVSAAATCVAPSGAAPIPETLDYGSGWVGTASISGTTMAITVNFGTDVMAVGRYIYAPNSLPGEIVAEGTQVITDLGGGNWEVNISQTVTSRDLMGTPTDSFLTTGSWMGGIAGDNGLPGVGDTPGNLVENCENYALLQNSDVFGAACVTGGIVGYQGDGTTEDCSNYGAIIGGYACGGVVGQNALYADPALPGTGSTIQRCGTSGNITAYASLAGGITGLSRGTVRESWSSGNVVGTSTVGGAIGILRETGIAEDIFSFGNATGTSIVGGLIGQVLTGAAISQAYSLGVPTAPSRVGGSIAVRGTGVTATNVYWDIDSSGNPVGVGSGVSTGVTGLSDAALLAGMPSGFGSEWSRGVITPNYPILNTAPTPPNPTVVLNPPLSMSFVSSATSVDSTTITMPTDIRAGDYAYLISFAQNTTSSAPSNVTVTDTSASPNWTLVNQQFSNATNRACRINASIKILLGTETTVSGMTTGTRGRTMIVMVFRPSNPVTGDTWTRLNARVVINGAATGSAPQSMAAGTSPCVIVGCAVYDSGTPPANQISLGDDEVITATSVITPALVSRASYHVNNTGAASSTYNGDTDAGGVAIICVNVSLS